MCVLHCPCCPRPAAPCCREAQATKDARVELLIATEHDAAGTPIALDFHSIVFERDKTVAEIELLNRGANLSGARVPLDFAAATAAVKSAPIDLKQFIFEWIGQVADESLRHFPWGHLPG